MIRNERELTAAQAQIAQMERALIDLRRRVTSDDYRLLARNSRRIIERMQSEILDYLSRSDALSIPRPTP